MKKVFILTILALASAMAYAGPVSKEKALQVASKVFAAEPATKAAVGSDKLTVVWDGEFEKTKGATDPAFYVVAREKGGFVIVAGNDNVQPVLGFSFENPFKVEGMPDNVRWWMEQIKVYSRSARTSSPEIRQRWGAFEDTKASASPISGAVTNEYLGSRTNEWNQTNPANYYCPDVAGQSYTAVCGCLPLAVAEVMSWFGTANISSASGTVPSYSYTSDNKASVTIPAHELGTVYDWANLKALTTPDAFLQQINQYTGSFHSYEELYQVLYSGAEKGYVTLTPLGENLAHLVYDIGTLLEAEYNDGVDYSGTGSVTRNIPALVGPVMRYNNTARLVSKDGYTDKQWTEMLKAQISQHPIIYDGSSSETGSAHAYVADGYAEYAGDTVLHINLGWGGHNNGYYYTDIQNIFDVKHRALFDFYPNLAASTPIPVMGYQTGGGMQYISGYNTGTLKFTLLNIRNTGNASFSGDIYAGIQEASGEVSIVTPRLMPITDLGIGWGWNTISHSYSVSSDPPALGQQISMYYKESGKDTYYPFSYEPKIVNGFIALPIFPAAFIKTKASYSVGDYFVFQLTNHNYQYDTATWTVTDPSGTSTDYTMDDYRVELSTAGEYKITVSIPGQEKVTAFIKVD